MAEYQGKRFKQGGSSSTAPSSAPSSGSRFVSPAQGSAFGAHAAGSHVVESHAVRPAAGSHAAGHPASVPRSAAPASASAAHARGAHAAHSTPAANPYAASQVRASGSRTGYTVPATSRPAVSSAAAAPQGAYARTSAPRPAAAQRSGGAVPPTRISSGGHAAAGGSGDGRRPKRRRILPIILILIGVILLGVDGFILGKSLLGYREAVSTYDKIAEYAPVDDSAGDGLPVVDFDALQELNPDIVAWIYVPGTSINYPVVQGDDNDYYLNHLFDGTYNPSGAIFLDCDATQPGMVDQQTAVYGHHMNNRTMFYEIDDTTDQANFDKIECVYYITPETTYRTVPLMTSVVDETYVEARRANFSDALTLVDYLGEMREKASAIASDADERIESATQVLTLITCSQELAGNTRSIMVLTVDEEQPTIAAGSAADSGAAEDGAAGDVAADAASADDAAEADAVSTDDGAATAAA